jgi:hypothetical protein
MDVEQFAARALAAHRDENVFLYIHQNAPNTADTPPKRFRKAARPAWDGKDYGLYRYLACLAQADFTFGRFLEMIRKIGWEDKAVIAFSADHGQVLSKAHEIRTPDGPDSMRRALWFHGQTLYDEELRVPLLVRGPGIRQGLVIPGQYRSLYLYTTLKGLIPASGEGSYHPGFSGDMLGIVSPRTKGWDIVPSIGKESACVRVENRYKYIRWENPRRLIPAGKDWTLKAVPEELFNLSTDPKEMNNLASTQPELLELMRGRFDSIPQEFPEVWALRIPDGVADKVLISDIDLDRAIIIAKESRVTKNSLSSAFIEFKGEISLALPVLRTALMVEMFKDGGRLSRTSLRIGPAFVEPSRSDYSQNDSFISVEPLPEYRAKQVPPDPDGVPRPHLCVMRLDDWIAETPETGTMEAAVKDLMKQWGYVQ